uniref:Secondary thiamine-phosphate synthase enzyme n=1 Tax=Candidatus Kentrum sp. LFY TaxID=2126342 RepID=A0A450UY94_9GAMM|nr:MAG: secondary thiamine-phosphate synthase enzyme [Candidatus Kentron sp. LFY]
MAVHPSHDVVNDGIIEDIAIEATEGETMHKTIQVNTNRREELVDITPQVEAAVKAGGVTDGLVNVYVRGATAAIMVQENWDDSVQSDVINFLAKSIPRGVWLHDRQDGNGDSHLKAGLVGPSESVPILGGKLGLSTWQNLFLCEFDGPRRAREVVCTILG